MINKAKELNLAIKETNLAKEYLKNNDLKNYQASNNTLKVLKEEFFASPLISNYISIKDEMHRFLEQIVNILSE